MPASPSQHVVMVMDTIICGAANPASAPAAGRDSAGDATDTNEQAIFFLRRFHPATPWMLVTIGADGKMGPAATFDPKRDEAKARKFVDDNNGKRNIYFTVNRVEGRLTKKPAKADISEIHWLHVDKDLDLADWSDAEAVNREKARVLQLLGSLTMAPTIAA